MAIFRQYNIQLLPLNTQTTEEVGRRGYKEFFKQFSAYTINAYKSKMMAHDAKLLINDTYICPFVINAEQKFAYGKFVKYHKAETVTDLYSQKRLFEAREGDTAISNTHYFRFAFDYEYHRFCIEENGSKLPSPDVMMSTLVHFLERLALQYFPHHVLTVNLISDQRTLNEVMEEGNEYGAIDVKIAFPNSHRLNETLRELKEINAHSIQAHVAPARGARMTGIPSYIRHLIENSALLGESKIVFFKSMSSKVGNRFKRLIYSTSDHPQKLALRQKKSEDEYGFIQRVWTHMKSGAQIDNDAK